MEAIHIGRKLIACVLACALLLFCPVLPQSSASAVTVSEARAVLDSAEAQMQSITAECDALNAEIQELQTRIDETVAQAMVAQEAVIAGRQKLSDTAVYDYREGMAESMLELVLGSGNFEDLLRNIEYVSQLMEFHAEEVQAQKARKAELDAISAELDEQKQAQEEALAELEEKRAEAERVVASAAQQLANAEAAEAARLAALQAAAQQMQQNQNQGSGPEVSEDANTTGRQDAVPDGTPVVGGGNNENTSGGTWYTGIASAYGGSSDPYTPNPGTTATGALCDDNSMGVAVPMSMPNYRSYFGRTVEIRYNGMTVYAVVNDCGYMGNGSRVLDLQPGVFKAFGYSNCYAWGLRTVSYRFL